MSSNLAHELRTPIAELRNLAGVGTQWPEKRKMVQRFFEDVRTISTQMEKVVVNLLALARYESGKEILRFEEVEIIEAVDGAWYPQGRGAAAKDIILALDLPAGLTVRTDPERLQSILVNLFSNAVTYSAPGSTVRCYAVAESTRVTLVIANPSALARIEPPLLVKNGPPQARLRRG